MVRRNVNLLENLHCYSFFLCSTLHFVKCYTSHIVGIEVGCSVNVSLTWFLEKDYLVEFNELLKETGSEKYHNASLS